MNEIKENGPVQGAFRPVINKLCRANTMSSEVLLAAEQSVTV